MEFTETHLPAYLMRGIEIPSIYICVARPARMEEGVIVDGFMLKKVGYNIDLVSTQMCAVLGALQIYNNGLTRSHRRSDPHHADDQVEKSSRSLHCMPE